MKPSYNNEHIQKIEELENRLAEAEQLIEAIKQGEVDAFAVYKDNQPEIYTLKSGDYAYRVLIEKFGEGALNLTENGLIVYCNTYFCNLLNIPYEKIVGKNFIDFVSEESRAQFNILFETALTDNSKGEINLCMDDVPIPVYISLTSLRPNLNTVGIIITDMTEKKQQEQRIVDYQRELAEKAFEMVEKNNELERQNSELASFTYVASHDLQEPLRKIESFASRIGEIEKGKLSEKGVDYFGRIIKASGRMRELIDALLNYSRSANADNIFNSHTDLNNILKVAKSHIKEEIKEKGAIIESGDLPTLDLIKPQFIQLFINLISNALKYSKPGVKPHITISARLVEGDKIKSEVRLPEAKYWEISFADNGIGFRQEYANKIFELFRRLHGKSEFEGAGIGLAICRKIVQNHRGLIIAVGTPDEGSTFCIYLPAEQKEQSEPISSPSSKPVC